MENLMHGHTGLSVEVLHLSDDRVALVVSGELDESNADVVDGCLARVIAGEGSLREIVLAVSDLRFIDSTGRNVLVRHRQRLDTTTAIVIEDPSEHIRRVLEITGLDDMFLIRSPATM